MAFNNNNNESCCSYYGGDDWRIWQTIHKLEQDQSISMKTYPEITSKVVCILKEWAEKWAGSVGWMHLLNKSALFHEIEESIVALHYLIKNTSSYNKDFIVLDVCAGKGLFSFLLSYFRHPRITEIVLLEKDNKINWNHILVGNQTAEFEGRPIIQIWRNTNLHEYDDVLDRMINLSMPVALSGIHLCKQLSPSFIGLVNGLGNKCIYACLTPCCMPSAVTSQKKMKKLIIHSIHKQKQKKFQLSIQLEESIEEREARKDYMIRRERLRHKPKGGPCFYCCDPKHDLRDCPILPTLPNDEQISIRQAWHKATVPCWHCLQFGHYKNECPAIILEDGSCSTTTTTTMKLKCSSSHNSMSPPTICLDVSDILQTSRPYLTYCNLLSTSFQTNHHNSVEVIETELEKDGKHQENNWNNERKAIFIVVK